MFYKTPTKLQLTTAAPFNIWQAAIKQAIRSDHKRHRTGAVIFRGEEILSKGCSHTHGGGLKVRSLHAEREALSNLYGNPVPLPDVVIVTLTKANNFAAISKPCRGCAEALEGKVDRIIFAERANDESWQVLVLLLQELLDSDLKLTRYVQMASLA